MSDVPQINVSVVDGLPEAPQDDITYGRRNAVWVDMTSPANLQVRRGTAAEVAAEVLLDGEPAWATDTKVLVVGDGQTQGGVLVGHSLLDGFGGGLTLKVLVGRRNFGQESYQGPGDGELGITIPANSLVIGAAYRLGAGGIEDSDPLEDFAIGWDGDTDALFSGESSSANGSGVEMFPTPLWLPVSKEVSLEPDDAQATNLSGDIRVAVYFYTLSAMGTLE